MRPTSPACEPQLRRFLDFDCGANAAILVNNYDWMGRFGYLEFLRDVGKHFPVNVMLTKDSVRSRLERSDAGLSYTEFSYMLLQAYDFVYLNEHYGCELQAAGAISGATSRPASTWPGGSAACSSTAAPARC